MSAGGYQTTAVDGSYDPIFGCYGIRPGCTGCFTCKNMAAKGFPKGLVHLNLVSAIEKVHDTCRIRPSGIYLLCSDSDLFLPEVKHYWPMIAKKLCSRPDVVFVALTKRLRQAEEWHQQFGTIPNLWLGTSVENRAAMRFIPELYLIPAAGYILSFQPLLEPLPLTWELSHPQLRYVLAGCEKGEKARPCDNSWLDEIEERCQDKGVEYFCPRRLGHNGEVIDAPTRNGRGSGNSSRKSYNPHRRRKDYPTIGAKYFNL